MKARQGPLPFQFPLIDTDEVQQEFLAAVSHASANRKLVRTYPVSLG